MTKSTKSKRALYNTERPPSGDAETERKLEFARRLQSHMVALGWNQSELARRAEVELPTPTKGQKQRHTFPRDLVSLYVRGRRLPRPEGLEAICKALSKATGKKITADMLVPPGAQRPTGEVIMHALSDGQVDMRFSRVLPMVVASKIVALLKTADRP